MDKKTFVIIIVALSVTFTAAAVVQYYQPESKAVVDFSSMPLTKGAWTGVRETVPDYVMDLLRPKEIFSASYTNNQGQAVHLLFDFFVSDGSFGGPHSPRNCLPGSGWLIEDVTERNIEFGSTKIPAGRFRIKSETRRQVMDFWYVTNYGMTASDYKFKLYSMLSSLSLQPREVAFIRFVTADDSASLVALDDFESEIIPEVFGNLPFDLE